MIREDAIMIRITKEELLKLASAANLTLTEDEIPALVRRLESVLSYASYLQEYAGGDKEVLLPHVSNVTREDLVKETPVEPLLALAPEHEENFYVVPAILKQ